MMKKLMNRIVNLKIEMMKKIYLLVFTTSSFFYFGQVGIGTSNPKSFFHIDGNKDNPMTGLPTATQELNDVAITSQGKLGIGIITPTQSLDVNGMARIRTTDYKQMPDATDVITAETDGTLTNSKAVDVLYSSGIYTRSRPNNVWTGILTGAKSARLDFTGKTASASNSNFIFSVFYVVGSGFTVVPNSVIPSGAVTITPVSATSLKIIIAAITYTLNFSSIGDLTNIQTIVTDSSGNPSGLWIQGTFHSTPNIN